MPPDDPSHAVLTTNQSFYEAFARRDISAIDALWSTTAPVACIHPGWAALHGRDEVIASWRAILEGAGAPAIVCGEATAHVMGAFAFVVCSESIGTAELIATNIFIREEGEWRLVHHQAGPVSARRPEAQRRSKPPPKPRVLN